METVLIKEGEKDFERKLEAAAQALKAGKLVAFPTETVYGLGANALDDAACRKIYLAKGRPSDNPLIVHVCDMKMAFSLVESYDERFLKIADAFWPGPISFILHKNQRICPTVSAGLDTVALRMPSHESALSLIKKSQVPIAAPSANISGRPSPTRSEHVIFDLSGRVDYIICSELFPIGVESTVLDLSTEKAIILRPGAITPEMILQKTGVEVIMHEEGIANTVPKSPGTKYRHYSPKAKVYMVGPEFRAEDLETFALSKACSPAKAKFLHYADDVEMARKLFADFRLADQEEYEIVLVQPVRSGALLEANLNRLKKACES